MQTLLILPFIWILHEQQFCCLPHSYIYYYWFRKLDLQSYMSFELIGNILTFFKIYFCSAWAFFFFLIILSNFQTHGSFSGVVSDFYSEGATWKFSPTPVLFAPPFPLQKGGGRPFYTERDHINLFSHLRFININLQNIFIEQA